MKKIILYTINIYQKYISPYKGFSCAYGVATGKISCSGYGKKVINRFGVIKGYMLLKRRFIDCSICNKEIKKRKKENTYVLNSSQKGVLDIDCIGALLDGGCQCGCDALSNRLTKDINDCFFSKKDSDNEEVEKRKKKVEKEIIEHNDYVKFQKAENPYLEKSQKEEEPK